jgi:hypothetical protein
MKKEAALEAIASNEWTVLVINADGTLKEVAGLKCPPGPMWAHERREQLRGCAVRDVPKRILTMVELDELIAEAVSAIKLFRDYEEQ